MTNLLDQLNKAKQGVNLSAGRKAAIKIALMDQMRAPKRATFFSFIYSRSVWVGALSLVIILSGAATASASQVALPGDTLYPVKVGVVEKVKAAFARTDEAKAELALDQLEKRMDEGVELAAHDSLDSTAETKLDNLMAEHAEKFKTNLEKISADDEEKAAELNSRYQAIIYVHNQALQNLSDKSKLNDSLDEQSDEAAQVSAELEDKAANGEQPSVTVQNKINAANNVIREAQNFINQKAVSFGVSADSKTAAQAQLASAQNLITQANAQLVAKNYKQAVSLANQAIRAAQESKSTIKINFNLKVEVNNSGNSSSGQGNSGNGNQSPESFQQRLKEHWSNGLKLDLQD